ncbi:hypothetical protein GobsT_46600 [Gemmata obscuriglobus]|uniref:Uncharacterized protein n=1 Tax=Gemmata obscuriglobus TaxID=114 RepID=A0A2Z3GSL5_9BACT|nr:hypothetical protein [Gemmata obscuriglobus]AWM37379.1 hypothetical protein C1280_10400 [Gemmata obscuriglobus]QEG29862.1 hypothetical protein GobsT_46600 [Gemmata obscuriglobus]VTS09179.1 hypothetical protein : Putative uncharacterized protein OS=Candidatus Kuenenia stuttgartiensis GN=kustb0147 PE=4 SV=1: CsgG [Gemmata obscuriglobus UQM 2246]
MTTRLMGSLAVLAVVVLAGCELIHKHRDKDKPLPGPPTFSQYHLEGWQWDRVARVVVLPFRNETGFTRNEPGYTRVGEEAREAFIAELNKVGRFEVIPTALDDRAYLAALSRCGGRFDEPLLYDIAKATNADVVVYGVVTNYSPYPRPRMGLVLQAVGPEEAKVVASVDGLWDTTDQAIADRIRVYYRQRSRERPAWVRNHVIASDDSFAGELALDSPNLFRRFVSREAVLSLLGYPVPGVVMGADGALIDPAATFPARHSHLGCLDCQRLGRGKSCTHLGATGQVVPTVGTGPTSQVVPAAP